MYKFLLFLLILSTSTVFAQDSLIIGKITTAETSEPIPYVNIGIPMKGIGTVTNSQGEFVLELRDALESDTIRFSYLGYQTLNYSVASLRKQMSTDAVLEMKEDATLLEEVVIVRNKKLKKKVLGSDTESELGMGHAPSLGSEIGRRINIKKANTQLLNFRTHITENSYESIRMRLNFYHSVDKEPGEKINKENIYVDFDKPSGHMEIDLEKFGLFVDDDIIVTLEWVDFYGEGEFKFSCKVGTSGLKQKYTSEGSWSTYPLTLGFNMLVAY